MAVSFGKVRTFKRSEVKPLLIFDPPLKEGDTVEMKKGHACGANLWQILMAGADVRLKCIGCGRVILMDRVQFRKKVKRRVSC